MTIIRDELLKPYFIGKDAHCYTAYEVITPQARYLEKGSKGIPSKNSKLIFSVFGLDSMPSYKMNDDNHLAFKTYITEEMLKKGFLATDSIYVSISHDNKKLLERYFYELDNVCKNFKKKLDNGDMNYKKNELSKSTFSRLN